ncbi:hypothetical protein RDI58_008163 [Solanum bulbocastanum]|uniref:Uncharacterized protein n=1 Tax=Solanum bulbocastanum TaxID=147425 RepID=A0AAN8YJB2_SOLBU
MSDIFYNNSWHFQDLSFVFPDDIQTRINSIYTTDGLRYFYFPSWALNSNGLFSMSSVYKLINQYLSPTTHSDFNWIWQFDKSGGSTMKKCSILACSNLVKLGNQSVLFSNVLTHSRVLAGNDSNHTQNAYATSPELLAVDVASNANVI